MHHETTELWAIAILGAGALHAMPSVTDAIEAAQDINSGCEMPVVAACIWPDEPSGHAASLAVTNTLGTKSIKDSALASSALYGLATKRRIKAVEKLIAMKAVWTSAGWVLPDPADIEHFREAVSFYTTYAKQASMTCAEERDYELMRHWDAIAERHEALLRQINRKHPASTQGRHIAREAA